VEIIVILVLFMTGLIVAIKYGDRLAVLAGYFLKRRGPSRLDVPIPARPPRPIWGGSRIPARPRRPSPFAGRTAKFHLTDGTMSIGKVIGGGGGGGRRFRLSFFRGELRRPRHRIELV